MNDTENTIHNNLWDAAKAIIKVKFLVLIVYVRKKWEPENQIKKNVEEIKRINVSILIKLMA